MPRYKNKNEDFKRVTLSTSNVSIRHLNALSEYYAFGENQTYTLRLIMDKLVNDQEMIADFTRYYRDVFSKIKQYGVTSSSIKKTYYIYPSVLEKFKSIKKKVTQGKKQKTLLSEIFRALIYYFYKIKIEDRQDEIDKLLKKLEKKWNYRVLSHRLTYTGLIVELDLDMKE